MQFIHDTREISLDRPSIVTIGKFDGFHRGHQKLLKAAVSLKKADEQVVVFTFSRSPQMVLAGKEGTELGSREEKLKMAETLGVDVLVEYPFTDEVRHITAEEFLRDILCGQLKAKHIVAGPDCRFGYARQGNIEYLLEHQEIFGYQVHVVEKEQYRLRPISSSRIREALGKGQIPEANDMLGYRFGYRNTVIHGRKLGRTLGFPTINQWVPDGKIVPAFGVYASMVEIDGVSRPAISNVGMKPTLPGEIHVSIETYIYNYQGDLYGRELRVELLRFQRPERKFFSLEALKKQVEHDKEEVRSYFAAEGELPGSAGPIQEGLE